MNADMHDADAEVELSAEDLRALSAAARPDQVTQAPTPLVYVPIPAPRRAPPPRANASGSRDRRNAVSRVGVSLGVVIAVVAAAGLLRTQFSAGDSGPTSAATLNQSASPGESATPAPNGEPVRFANPFDADEVFEFPSGTTEAEARDAVADFLMERAVNRQARLKGAN